MKKIINIGYLLFITFVACQKKVPDFNAENAFEHLKAQCDFGPRNPGILGDWNPEIIYFCVRSL